MAGGFFSGTSDVDASAAVIEVEEHVANATEQAEISKEWAIGDGTVGDDTVDPPDTIADDPSSTNNAQYWARVAHHQSLTAGQAVESDGTTIDGDGTSDDTLRIVAGGVNTTQLADDAVTTAKLADNAVDTDKLANSAVDTAQLADDAVSEAKLDISNSATEDFYLQWNGSALEWSQVNSVTPHSDDLEIALNHTSITQNEASVAITVTLSAGSATLTNQAITVTTPTGTILDSDDITQNGNVFSFNATDNGTIGHYRIDASATFEGSVHSTSATIRVIAATPVDNDDWFTWVRSSVPSSNSDDTGQTDHGPFVSGDDVTFTGDGGSDNAYIALPTATYEFREGVLFASVTEITSGYTQSGYTLYQFNDFDDSQDTETFILTINGG